MQFGVFMFIGKGLSNGFTSYPHIIFQMQPCGIRLFEYAIAHYLSASVTKIVDRQGSTCEMLQTNWYQRWISDAGLHRMFSII